MSDETMIENPVVTTDQPTDTSTESTPTKNNDEVVVDAPMVDPLPTFDPEPPKPTPPPVQVDAVVNPTTPKLADFGLMKTRYTYDVQDSKDKFKSVVTISIICDDPEMVSKKIVHVIENNIGSPERFICVLQSIEVLE